jgi:hypothetical protein
VHLQQQQQQQQQQPQSAHLTALQSIAAHAPTHGTIMRSRTPPTRSSSGGSMRGGDAFNSISSAGIPASPAPIPTTHHPAPVMQHPALALPAGLGYPPANAMGNHAQQPAAMQANPSTAMAGHMYPSSSAALLPSGSPPSPAVPRTAQVPAQSRPVVQQTHSGASAGGMIKAFNLDVLLS